SAQALAAVLARALAAGRDAAAQGDVETAWKHCAVALDIEAENGGAVALNRQLLDRTYARIRKLWRVRSPNAIRLCNQYLERQPAGVGVLRILGPVVIDEHR